ncbi:MAG TPA: VOC family protein [Pyrinomonadaceae bacterium]|nr:VOC family protein [Pyrinomonadaceae bacterium]
MKTRQLVPLLFVADVERSIDFYKHLGFELRNTFTAEGATKPTWAWLRSENAPLMLAAANEPVIPDQQRVLFYLYTDDVQTAHDSLTGKGLTPGPITTPFYAPRGEFELVDPDGYVLMLTHT